MMVEFIYNEHNALHHHKQLHHRQCSTKL